MPNEPLVVLHTFLTNEISKSMIGIVQNPKYLTYGMYESIVFPYKDISINLLLIFES